MKKELRAALILLFASVIWGFSMPIQREADRFLSPMTFNACRFTLAAIVVLPFALTDCRKKADPLRKKEVLPGILLGLALFLSALFQQIGVGESGAGKAGFLTALYVVLVPICGIFFGKKTGLTTWLALLIALPALYLLCVPKNEAFRLAPSDGAILLGSVGWTAHILMTDSFVKKISPLKLCSVQFASAAAFNWIGAVLTEKITPGALGSALLPIVYCGVLSTGFGFVCQGVGQKDCRPAIASLIMSMEAVFSLIGGALLLGERMETRGLIGCALMFLAVLLAQAGALFGGKKNAPDADAAGDETAAPRDGE